MRRIYNAVSQTLGFRTLEQLKVMLHALGHYRAGTPTLERDADAMLYTADAVAAVEAFRAAEQLSTRRAGSPPGLVDPATVDRLWAALERAGKARAVREQLLETTAVRR
jgi:hypothetical protein